ncbi:MAG: hypothetical protein MR691_08435 [Clostridium sp.]|nr:hypothetical protein [Clostridium sp.]
MHEELKKQVEEKIKTITDSGITPENIKALGELVDIHKDLSNEQYWEKKEEVLNMRYMRDDYRDDYGRRSRDSRGRYMGRGNYEGEDMIDEMREHYDNYMEGARYSGPEKEKAFDYMLKSAEDFFCYLMEEVENPEQMEKIRRTARKISEM